MNDHIKELDNLNNFLEKNPKKKYMFLKKIFKKLNYKKLRRLNLHSTKISSYTSEIAKDKKIRDIVHAFQQKCAYNPPSKYAGSVLDGRDIITVQVKDATFKFFITASLETRAKRRYKEYLQLNKKISLKEVLKNLRNRDKSDRQRKYGPLKKTRDSILINTTKLSKKACFLKIKAVMDRKLYN